MPKVWTLEIVVTMVKSIKNQCLGIWIDGTFCVPSYSKLSNEYLHSMYVESHIYLIQVHV